MNSLNNKLVELNNEKVKNIIELLPNLKINSYELINTGANSEAFLVNNEFIFRFPLKKEVYEDYKLEKQVLDEISLHIKSTKVPKIEIFAKDKIFFSKHKLIEGTDFYKSKLNTTTKEKIARQVAKFYFELHSINEDKFDFLKNRKFNLENYDISNKNYELNKILDNNFNDNIIEKMDFLYKIHNNFNSQDNVLCHRDLHEENIIINNSSLSGIIDFGNSLIANRNIDFATILEYDVKFGLLVIKEYEKLANKKLNFKYIFYLQKIICYNNLLYFVETKNEKYIKMFKTYIVNLNSVEKLLIN